MVKSIVFGSYCYKSVIGIGGIMDMLASVFDTDIAVVCSGSFLNSSVWSL